MHREIAVISHTVIHCDKENHNYAACKLHRMLTRLLSSRFFSAPSNLWIQHHRNSQRSRERPWIAPRRSWSAPRWGDVLVLAPETWAEHRKGSPYTSLSLRPALFLVPSPKIISDLLSHNDSEGEEAKVCWRRKRRCESSWLPKVCSFYSWKKQGVKFVPPFSWVFAQVVTSQCFSSQLQKTLL